MKNNIYKSICGIFCLLAFVVFGLVSCVDLEETPDEVNINPNTLETVAALEALVTGAYREIQDNAQWSAFYIAAYGGDDISTHSASNKIGFRDSDRRVQNHSSARLGDAYNGCYDAISVANTAIEAVPGIEEANVVVEGAQEAIDVLNGEAHFMRAFSYFHLTRTFGRVALQLETNSTEALGRASFLEIYAQIEADLEVAEMLLPDSYPGISATGVRPSKGAAKAFLAKLYMHWAGYPIQDDSKYALAAEKAKEVIDGPYGYALSDNFRGMWTETERFEHSESIFSIVACAEICNIGNRTTGRLGLPGEAGGWTETFGEITFFEDHEAAATAEGTMQRFNDTYVLEEIPRGDFPIGADWRTWSDPHPVLRKVVGGDMINENVHNGTRSDINLYFMRYADVLLTYAEASGRQVPAAAIPADAWEALNKVRRRASGRAIDTPDPAFDLTSGDIAELAFTERKWEFAGEFQRWHDIVRMDRVVSVLSERSPDEVAGPASTSGEFLYFSPIPQGELDNAPQLKD